MPSAEFQRDLAVAYRQALIRLSVEGYPDRMTLEEAIADSAEINAVHIAHAQVPVRPTDEHKRMAQEWVERLRG